MANTLKNIINNRDSIRRIMALDSNGTMDKMLENKVKDGTLVYSQDGATYNPPSSESMNQKIAETRISSGMFDNSKLPKAILESFKINPIADAPLPEGMGGSVLDGIDIPPIKKGTQALKEQYTSQTGLIDYSLIRTIINEAVEEKVKKYVSAMAKKLINEGVGKNAGAKVNTMLMLGESIDFCDDEGNVYEATLKFKKNIKKKING